MLRLAEAKGGLVNITHAPYSPINIIFDVGMEWVTFWKNIL